MVLHALRISRGLELDWLGQGIPGLQAYEIVNPDTYETTDIGYAIPVPEPTNMGLLFLWGAYFLRKRY
jgi:hypothetical protein